MTYPQNQEIRELTANTFDPANPHRAALYARRKFTDQALPDEPDPTAVSQIIAMKTRLQDLPDVMIERVYMDCQKMDSLQPRPEFQQLLLDIQDGRYTCLVLYSLDRFGKDHAETEHYMLRQFPPLGLRIISIQDDYDSSISEPESGSFSRLEELLRRNKRPAHVSRQASVKEDVVQKRFAFSKRNIPYGYVCNPDSESHMDVDLEVAQYVRFIYEKYASGTTPGRIARLLTAMNAPTPSMRRSQLGRKYQKMSPSVSWSFGAVKHILSNQMYAGDYICGRESDFLHPEREDAALYWKNEERIISHHHDPIVPRALFDEVRRLQEQRRRRLLELEGTPHDQPEYSSTPFRNQLYCGHCGNIMHFYHDANVRHHYAAFVCSSRKKKLENACRYAPVRMSQILPNVKQALSDERRLALNVYEQMKDGKNSKIYQRLETYFQEKITALAEAGLEDGAGSNETAGQKNQKLTEAIRERETFHQAFQVTNPWLMLYVQLNEHFEITLSTARKYIYRIYLYPDAPIVFQPMKQEAKEKLLSYFALVGADSISDFS